MQNYLMNKIYIGDNKGCTISLVDKNERNALNHSLLKIVNENTNQILAWICVASNLYIAAEKIKPNTGFSWTNEGDKYYWHHICPDGCKTPFPLKKLDCIFEYDNKIEYYDINIINDYLYTFCSTSL